MQTSFQKLTCCDNHTFTTLTFFIIIFFLRFSFFFACEWTYSKADNNTPFWVVHYFFLSFFFGKKAKHIYKNLVKPWNQNCTFKFTLQMNADLYKKISLHGYIYTNTDITLMLEIMLLSQYSWQYISYIFCVNCTSQQDLVHDDQRII